MKVYHKLVRDDIPRIIRESGKECAVSTLGEDEYRAMLDEKLREELNEFLESHDPEELADLLEVLRAAARACGSSIDEVETLRLRKQAQRGAFEKRLCLDAVWEPGEKA